MKILTKFILSTSISLGLVTSLLGVSRLLIGRTEKSIEKARNHTNQAVYITHALMLSLETQTSFLKDYLLFNRGVFYLNSYQQEKSLARNNSEAIRVAQSFKRRRLLDREA